MMTSAISRFIRRFGWSFARSLFVIAALSRCADANAPGTRDEFFNMPVAGMNAGGFGFVVTARDWTYDQSYAPDLSGGTLQIGLVIAGYTRGTGQLSVTDASGASVFSQNLAGNLAAGNNTVIHGTAPFRVHVTTTGYSGIISLGINTATTTQ
jgi:hypothetical protein